MPLGIRQEEGIKMRRKTDKDFSKLFAKGQELETSISSSSIFSKDNGLHLMSYKVTANKKSTVIDNISIYGSTILVLESKNYTRLEGKLLANFWKGKGASRYFNLPNPINQNLYHTKLLREYLVNCGLDVHSFSIEYYVVVPDSCYLELDDEAKSFVLAKSRLDVYKSKLSFYNPVKNEKLLDIIKEGLK